MQSTKLHVMFGQALIKARLFNNHTLSEASKLSGVSANKLSRIESASTPLTLDIIIKVMEYVREGSSNLLEIIFKNPEQLCLAYNHIKGEKENAKSETD